MDVTVHPGTIQGLVVIQPLTVTVAGATTTAGESTATLHVLAAPASQTMRCVNSMRPRVMRRLPVRRIILCLDAPSSQKRRGYTIIFIRLKVVCIQVMLILVNVMIIVLPRAMQYVAILLDDRGNNNDV